MTSINSHFNTSKTDLLTSNNLNPIKNENGQSPLQKTANLEQGVPNFKKDTDFYLSETFIGKIFNDELSNPAHNAKKVSYENFIKQNVHKSLAESLLFWSSTEIDSCIRKTYELGALAQIFKNHGTNFSPLELYKNLTQLNDYLSVENSEERLGNAERKPGDKEFCLNDIKIKSEKIKEQYKNYLCGILGKDFMLETYPKLSAVIQLTNNNI